jgi:hypothetical protein
MCRTSQERTVEEQHEKALKAASHHGVPTDLFPLEAPWSLFPWYATLASAPTRHVT